VLISHGLSVLPGLDVCSACLCFVCLCSSLSPSFSLSTHTLPVKDFKALIREVPVQGPLEEGESSEVPAAWQLIRLPWELSQDWESAFPQVPGTSVPLNKLNMILRSMMQKVFGHYNWVAE
jgi:hypothetical protein